MRAWYEPLELDLHGLDTIEASSQTLLALYEFKNDEYNDTMDIIVGIGTGALRLTVEEILDKEGYRYSYLNNRAVIRVYK
ncbi:Smr/MutS family protein [Mycoplasma struthionis]|uniref:Smr domain-containing protein n=1 Tax=Mycoplasma struthionis TaxID=538220 RepID=A0A3G8LHA2_9MOLU|nr:Smr/MutS family protein [Mycoplasma struthionis]AZG68615.1 hypothetical protein EGN60_01365 [Mycoplasma struthionis]TPI02270.1 hypothetical protein FJM01_01215 [Mycoplasma struthionis]